MSKTCNLCKREFARPCLLDRHMKSKFACITRDEIMKLMNTLEERENDILTLVDDNESLRSILNEKNEEIILLKDQVRCMKEDKQKRETENIMLQTQIDCKSEMIKSLVTNNPNNIVNNDVTINNTIVVNQHFDEKFLQGAGKMSIRQALGGLEGVAEYLSDQLIIHPEKNIHSYYVTDASRRNGMYLNENGQWTKDEGGHVLVGTFGALAFQVRKSKYDYKDGLMDDGMIEEDIPEHVVNDIRNTRMQLMENTRKQLN